MNTYKKQKISRLFDEYQENQRELDDFSIGIVKDSNFKRLKKIESIPTDEESEIVAGYGAIGTTNRTYSLYPDYRP